VADEIINGLQPIVGQPHPVERLTLVPSGGGIFEVRKNVQFRHLRRLLLRVDRRKPLNAAEGQLARQLIQTLNLGAFQDLDAHCAQAVEAYRLVQAHRPSPPAGLGLLIWLLRCEAAAMVERKRWLEGELLPAHPEAIARLTPHLKLLEDRIQRALDLSHRLGRSEGPRDAPMGLEDALGPFFYSHLRDCLGKLPELAPLKTVVELQRARLVPTRDLTALATLFRWIQEARGLPGGPLDWIRQALEAWEDGHFRADVSGALPAIEPLLAEARVTVEGTLAAGNFGENPYTTWVARDGLTRPFRSQNPDRLPPDVRHTALANIHRDSILLRLLESPEVHNTSGLVESIVELSRSPAVHARIATRAELHSGAVNGRVPVALLRSPVSIPSALLRTLVHPSRVPLAELKALWRSRSTLRADVIEEIGRYLRQVHAI
jgi:hypothetical protein